MLVFNNYFCKNTKSKLHFEDRVPVLNVFSEGSKTVSPRDLRPSRLRSPESPVTANQTSSLFRGHGQPAHRRSRAAPRDWPTRFARALGNGQKRRNPTLPHADPTHPTRLHRHTTTRRTRKKRQLRTPRSPPPRVPATSPSH
jgi:hypothetical protein